MSKSKRSNNKDNALFYISLKNPINISFKLSVTNDNNKTYNNKIHKVIQQLDMNKNNLIYH